MKGIKEVLTFDPSIFPKEPEFIAKRKLILKKNKEENHKK